MKKIILWISSSLHFLTAIFASVSVKPDYSNQIPMMFATFALMLGAIVDAWLAININDAEKEKQSRTVYIGGYQPKNGPTVPPVLPKTGFNVWTPTYFPKRPMPPVRPAKRNLNKFDLGDEN